MMLRRLAFRPLTPIQILTGLVFLAACGQADLYSNVSERDANEMIVVLSEAGVDAKKKPGAEDTYTVAAPGADFTYAMSVLTAADFPRDQNDSMDELIRKKGIVSADSEVRLREQIYLSEQLNQTLSAIDGVQVARVHIVRPVKDPIRGQTSVPTAAVFIKHAPNADLASETSQIATLVANAVEDLAYDKVQVNLFPAKPMPVRQEPPVEQAAAEFAMPALGVLGAGGIAFGLITLMRRRNPPAGAIEGPVTAAEDGAPRG